MCVAIEQFTMVTGERILIWFLLMLGSITADWNPVYEVADGNQHVQDMIEALNARVNAMQNYRDDKIEDLERMLKELMNQKPSRDKPPEEEDSSWGEPIVPGDDYEFAASRLPGDGQKDLTNPVRKSDKLRMVDVDVAIYNLTDRVTKLEAPEKTWGELFIKNISDLNLQVNDNAKAILEFNVNLFNLTELFNEWQANFSHHRYTRDVANQYNVGILSSDEMGTDSARTDTVMTSLITRVQSLEKSVQRLAEYENRFAKLEEEIRNMKRKPKD